MQPATRNAALAAAIQQAAFFGLLIFAPLARGATERWAFCISLWLVLLALTAMMIRRLWQGEPLLPRTVLDLPIGLLLLLAGVSWFFSMYRQATSWAFMRLLLYIAAFYLTYDLASSKAAIRRMLVLLLGMGVLISLLGFIKYAGGSIPAFWKYRLDGHRLNSTFVNPNHAAGYLEMVFLFGLGYLFFRSRAEKMLLGSCLALIFIALLLSMSRGGWIATSASLMFMGAVFYSRLGWQRWKISLAITSFVLVVTLCFLGSNDLFRRIGSFSNQQEIGFNGRLGAAKATTQLIEEYPLWGTGLGTFPWSFTAVSPAGSNIRWREAHNDYVQIASEMGLPVLIPLGWGLFLIFRTVFKRLKHSGGDRFQTAITLGALGAIVAMLIHSLVDFNIQITSNGILFCVLVGLALSEKNSRHRSIGLEGRSAVFEY
ncbi:MAG: O-antigen ligase family protein [Deltaproteobacteria bacterium]|nr:O-antigen ligase family protein [Deltaproteobacteria bacterium]